MLGRKKVLYILVFVYVFVFIERFFKVFFDRTRIMFDVWTMEWVISFDISSFNLVYFGFWNLF